MNFVKYLIGESAGTYSEATVIHPFITQHISQDGDEIQGRIRVGYASGGFYGHHFAGFLIVLFDRIQHNQEGFGSGVHRYLSGGSLDEIRARGNSQL